MSTQFIPSHLPATTLCELLYTALCRVFHRHQGFARVKILRPSATSLLVIDKELRLNASQTKLEIGEALRRELDPVLVPIALRTLYPEHYA